MARFKAESNIFQDFIWISLDFTTFCYYIYILFIHVPLLYLNVRR